MVFFGQRQQLISIRKFGGDRFFDQKMHAFFDKIFGDGMVFIGGDHDAGRIDTI